MRASRGAARDPMVQDGSRLSAYLHRVRVRIGVRVKVRVRVRTKP